MEHTHPFYQSPESSEKEHRLAWNLSQVPNTLPGGPEGMEGLKMAKESKDTPPKVTKETLKDGTGDAAKNMKALFGPALTKAKGVVGGVVDKVKNMDWSQLGKKNQPVTATENVATLEDVLRASDADGTQARKREAAVSREAGAVATGGGAVGDFLIDTAKVGGEKGAGEKPRPNAPTNPRTPAEGTPPAATRPPEGEEFALSAKTSAALDAIGPLEGNAEVNGYTRESAQAIVNAIDTFLQAAKNEEDAFYKRFTSPDGRTVKDIAYRSPWGEEVSRQTQRKEYLTKTYLSDAKPDGGSTDTPAGDRKTEKPKEKPIEQKDVDKVKELQNDSLLKMMQDLPNATAADKAQLEQHFLAMNGYRIEGSADVKDGKNIPTMENLKRVEGFAAVAAMIMFGVKCLQIVKGKGEKPVNTPPALAASPNQPTNAPAVRNALGGLSVSNNAVDNAQIVFDANGQPHLLMRLPGGVNQPAARVDTPKGADGGSITILPDGTIRIDGITNLNEDGINKILKTIDGMKKGTATEKPADAPAASGKPAVAPPAKNEPSPETPPAGAPEKPPTAPATGAAESTDTPMDVNKIFGTLRDNTLSGVQSKMDVAKVLIKDTKADIQNPSWGDRLNSFFLKGADMGLRGALGIGGAVLPKNALGKTVNESNQDVLMKAKEYLGKLESVKTQVEQLKEANQVNLEKMQALRKDIGLPALTRELVPDYDKFTQMVKEGVDGKTIQMDFMTINKELADADAALAAIETSLEVADAGAGFAAGLVPYGSHVYALSSLATSVAIGSKTPEQAATEFGTSLVLKKVGGKALKLGGGDKLIKNWVEKNVSKFANKQTLDLMIKAGESLAKKGIGKVIKGAEKQTEVIAGLSNFGKKQWNETILPALQKSGEKGQAALTQAKLALAEIGKGSALIYQDIQQNGFDNAAKDYETWFTKVNGPAIQAIEGVLQSAGMEQKDIDAFKVGAKEEFKAGIKTLNEMQEKGVGTVLSGFGGDLGVLYNEYIAPSVNSATDQGKEAIAQAQKFLKEVSDGSQILYKRIQKEGFTGVASDYKEQFHREYDGGLQTVEKALLAAGVSQGAVNSFKAGIEEQFNKGVELANQTKRSGDETLQRINSDGLGTVAREFGADLGVLYNTEIAPHVKNVTGEAKVQLEIAMKNLQQVRDGAKELYLKDRGTTVDNLQKAYKPSLDQAKDALTKIAGITTEKAEKYLNAFLRDIRKQAA